MPICVRFQLYFVLQAVEYLIRVSVKSTTLSWQWNISEEVTLATQFCLLWFVVPTTCWDSDCTHVICTVTILRALLLTLLLFNWWVLYMGHKNFMTLLLCIQLCSRSPWHLPKSALNVTESRTSEEPYVPIAPMCSVSAVKLTVMVSWVWMLTEKEKQEREPMILTKKLKNVEPIIDSMLQKK